MVSNCIKVMLILGVVVCLSLKHISAAPAGGVVFNEIQTGGSTSATDEFIELYNAGSSAVSLATWQVQYNSASNATWDKPTRKISLNGIVQAHGYYLIGSTGGNSAIKPNLTFTSTLAGAGGHLRLVNGTIAQDIVAWGTAVAPLVAPAPAPPSSKSLNRLLGDDGNPLSPTSNLADYYIGSEPTPGSPNSLQTQMSLAAAGQPVSLEISEVLPNPASPLTDATGEFVELYNSGAAPIELSGYKLTSGISDSYKYVLGSTTINPGQYRALYSSQTHLTLSNSAGRVRLYDNTGALLDETASYGKAADGQSWIFAGDIWQWTTSPTPNTSNILNLPVAAVSKTKSNAVVKSSSRTTKPKTRAAVASKNSKKSGSQSANLTQSNQPAPSTNSHPYILAGAGVLALLYACYEYRYDLANRLHRFRKNRATRRTVRRPA